MTEGSLRKILILPAVLVMLASFVVPIKDIAAVGSEREDAGRILKLQEVQRIEDGQADYLYIVEYDEDDIPTIVKYRMAPQK